MPIIAYSSSHDHSSNHRMRHDPASLLMLLAYAHTHRHSSQWIGALMNLLQRRGGMGHG
jgi:hypothetical protein